MGRKTLWLTGTFFLDTVYIVNSFKQLGGQKSSSRQGQRVDLRLSVSQICITTHPDAVLPIRVECKNVATVNIPPKMAASSVISVKVC